jgi:hypothetical protein
MDDTELASSSHPSAFFASMVLSKLWHRRRRFRASSSDHHPPAVITVRKWVDSDRRDGMRPRHGADSLTNSVDDEGGVRPIPVQECHRERPHDRVNDGHHSERQERPTNVTVKTKLIMKEDRICGMVETTGDKLGKAVELVAIGIFALVVVATSTLLTIWGAMLVAISHYYEWSTTCLVVLGCLVAAAMIGTLLVRWIQQYIQKKTQSKKKSNASFVVQNSTATWTDVSDLAE